MSQKEQFEFVCINCSNVSIFETEPPSNYKCEICSYDPPKKEHDSKFSKNYVIAQKPSWWRCGNHHQTFKWSDSCPECSKKFTKRNFPDAGRVILPNLDDQKTKNEIEMSKTETLMRNKVKEKQLALEQATLDTPVLLKQLIEKIDRVLEAKNEV